MEYMLLVGRHKLSKCTDQFSGLIGWVEFLLSLGGNFSFGYRNGQ